MQGPSLLLALVAVALAAPDSSAADGAGRLVFREVKVKRATHRYAVWLPPGHDPAQRWPALVFLHGSGESGTDGEKPTRVGLGPRLEEHPERWPFVVVFPQKPLEAEEWEEREDLVFAALDRATREFAIDPKRVGLTGMSQGGHGTWHIGARHAKRWACLAPVCGYGHGSTLGPRLVRMPVWAFHGLRDDVVDPGDTRRILQRIHEHRARAGLGPDGARMTLFPDANHNSWDPAYAHDSLNVWLRETLGAR